jgi:hypothetical protein
MKKTYPKYFLYALISIIIFNIACEKETDTQHPGITFYSPYENQVFNIFDTIPIEAKITDDEVITSVRIKVVDSSFNPALPSVYKYPETNKYNLKIDFPIEDYYLESGVYYVQIRAEDGTNFKNKYQKIFIESIPRDLEKIIVLTEKNENTIEVSDIDMSYSISSLFEITGDFVSSEITSRYKQLYVAGASQININTYSLKTYQLEWSLEVAPPLPMHTFDCLYYDQYLYSSFSYLYIYGYDRYGSKKFNTQISEAGIPSRLFKFKDLLLVDVQSNTGGNTYIYTYYTGTGSEKQKLFSTFKVIEFFAYDNKNVIIVANESGQGTLKLYDPYANVLTNIRPVPGKIFCSVKINENEYLIGTENGIFLYNYYQSLLTNVLPGKIAQKLQYDNLSSRIFVVCENQIEKIKYPVMVLEHISTFSDIILNIHLQYNK